mgnify:CR=1 FL=1|nr:helix-turn-helix domain-containing protein [uncultured Anaerostipes sp.]
MLLTVRELQELLHIGRDKAYALMHAKAFPSIKIGGQYYVSREELDKWLNRYAYKEFVL